MTDGHLAYCLDYHKETTVNTVAKLKSEMDAGMAYLIENGYPNKSITGDKEKDYYITQVAIWWYLDETTGAKNLEDSFKTTDEDSLNLRPIIAKLVNEAKQAKARGYQNPSVSVKTNSDKLNLSADKKSLVSNEIVVALTNASTYDVTLTEAPAGSYVTDLKGNKKTSFNNGENFKVVVPANDSNANITVTVTTNSVINKVYEYLPADPAEQNLVTPILYPETKTANQAIALNYEIVEVPDTNTSSIILYIVGALLMSSGIALTLNYAKNK